MFVVFLVVVVGCSGGGSSQPPGQLEASAPEKSLFVGTWEDMAPTLPNNRGHKVTIDYSEARKNLTVTVADDYNSALTDPSYFLDCRIDSVNARTLAFSYQSPLGRNAQPYTMTIEPNDDHKASLILPGGRTLVLTKW
jgi:hypothetical protein